MGSDEKNSVFGSRWPVGPSRSARDASLVWIVGNATKRRRMVPKLYVEVVGPGWVVLGQGPAGSGQSVDRATFGAARPCGSTITVSNEVGTSPNFTWVLGTMRCRLRESII